MPTPCHNSPASPPPLIASPLLQPVYLASCKQLLVLAGDTYTTRLWCVMELFVYLIMGGKEDNIEVLLLPTDQVVS